MWRRHEPRADWILEDILRHPANVLIVSKYMLVAIALPECPLISLLVVEAGELFRACYEFQSIRLVGHSFHQQMQMIGYEAVRSNCKGLVDGRSPNLQGDELHGGSISKELLFGMAAERQEVSMQTDVVKCPKMSWAVCGHTGG